MGFLNFFSKSAKPRLTRLPSGSFTMDREGRVISTTLPQSFPASHMQEMGRQVLAFFRAAETAQMPLSEMIVYYSALKLTARELRGGAIVFVTPQTLTQNEPLAYAQ